ncbi:MAG: hypothetical protein KC463_07180 [Streptococcus sp.]|nr:hypothetical protein [Streptococcus sp.]
MATSLENEDVVVTLLAFSREIINGFANACGDLSLSVTDHARLIKFGRVLVRNHNQYTWYSYRSKRRDYWGDGREWISFYSRSENDGGVSIGHTILDTGEFIEGVRSSNLILFNPSRGWPSAHENYRGETCIHFE